MIKKLHNHLLENYPLLWNMRFFSVLTVVLLFHLLHFIVGYSSFKGIEEMGWREPGSMYFSTSFSMFSIIGACVIFILWLTRVFRNNAFKSFYPVSNGQLFLQFVLILSISLLNITYYYSYTYGYVSHARHSLNGGTNAEDIKVYNNVIGVLQSGKESYRIENRCAPAPFPLTKRYKENVQYTSPDNIAKEDYYYVAQNGDQYTSNQVDSMLGGVEYSYLNFCSTYSMLTIPNSRARRNGIELQELASTHRPYELLNNPKELKKNMEAFIQLCDRLKIQYRLDVNDWFNWVYKPPYFPVQYAIGQRYMGSSADEASEIQASMQLNPKGYYVELQKMQAILQNTDRAFAYSFDLGPFCGFLYGALAIALLIFTFRATVRRVWMISLIGSALLCMIVGAFTAVFAMNGAKDSVLYFYILLILSFLVVHLVSRSKTVSGVTLNWFVWSLPYVFVIVFTLVELFSYHSISPENGFRQVPDSGFKHWLEDNSDVYFFLCYLAYLAVIGLFMIPRFHYWQAMPED